jgi:hypothetical protein
MTFALANREHAAQVAYQKLGAANRTQTIAIALQEVSSRRDASARLP